MKYFYFLTSLLVFSLGNNAFSQVTIYSTDFGSTQTLPTGWSIENDGASTDDISIDNSDASNASGCSCGSGGDNIRLGNDNFNFAEQRLIVSGQISTVNLTDIQMSWTGTIQGGFPSVTVEYNADGGGWTAVGTYTPPTDDNGWEQVTAFNVDAGTEAEGATDLEFRFRYTDDGFNTVYRIDDFTVTGTSTKFYNVADANLTVTTNWGTNTDGTGTNPTNFTANNQEFHVRNGGVETLSSAWTVSGTDSKIVVEKATTLTANAVITGTVDVDNQGHLTLQNSTYPTLGTLATGSTVEYDLSTGTTITSGTYSNLEITQSEMDLSGNTTCDSIALNSVLDLNGNQLTINGQKTGSADFRGSNTSSMVISGTGDFGTLASTTTALTLLNLNMNRASTTVTLGDNLVIDGTGAMLTLTNGSLGLNGNILRVGQAGDADITWSGGSLVGSSSSTIQVLGSGSFSGLQMDQTDSDSRTISTFVFNRSGETCTVNSEIIIASNLQAGNGTTIDLNGQTINLADGKFTSVGTGVFAGNSCNISLTGTTNSFTMNLDQTSEATRTINNITMNRTGQTLTFGSATVLTGNLDIQAGGVDFNTQTVTLNSNASSTAQILEVQGTLSNANTVIAERYIAGSAGYRMICAPGSGALLSDLNGEVAMSGFPNSNDAGSSFVSTYFYNETLNGGTAENGYQAPTDISDPMTFLGASSAVITYLTSQTGATTPTPLTADFSNITITSGAKSYTNLSETGGSGTETGWHMLGNPYPCSVDVDSITLTNVQGTSIYLLETTGDGSFTTCTQTDACVLSSGEGFFVQVADGFGGNNTVGFNESDKVSTGDAFNKTVQPGLPDLEVWVQTNGIDDYSRIRFNNNATEVYDIHDANKMDNLFGNTDIAIVENGKNLALSSVPEDVNKTFPIRVYTNFFQNTTQTYTVELKNVEDLVANNKCITFEDAVAGVSFPVVNDTTYTFSMHDTVTVPRLFLTVNTPLEISLSDVSCAGTNDGSAAIDNPSSAYSYVWSDDQGNTIPVSSSSLNNITAGTYSVEVSGLSGSCPTATTSFEILDGAEIDVQSSITNVQCFGESTGEVSLSATGGAGSSFSYEWSDGSNNATLSGVAAGQYTATVTDNTGCEKTETFTIGENDATNVLSNVTDAECYGENTGAIDLEVSNAGAFVFTYSWSNGETTQDISNIGYGQYDVTITDEFGCETYASELIDEPAEIMADFEASEDTLNINQGALVMFANNSSGSDTYSWDFGDGNTSTDESPWNEYTAVGTYTVEMTAINGNCSETYSDVIVVNSISGIEVNDSNSEVKYLQNGNELFAFSNAFNSGKVQVDIYNTLGQRIISKVDFANENMIAIDLPQTTGTYLIKISSKDKQFVKKHVITKQ